MGRKMRLFFDTNVFLAILNKEESWQLVEQKHP